MPDAIAAKALPLLRKRSCGMDENCAHFDANKTNKLLRIIPPPVAMKNLPSCRDTLPLAVKVQLRWRRKLCPAARLTLRRFTRKSRVPLGARSQTKKLNSPKSRQVLAAPTRKNFSSCRLRAKLSNTVLLMLPLVFLSQLCLPSKFLPIWVQGAAQAEQLLSFRVPYSRR